MKVQPLTDQQANPALPSNPPRPLPIEILEVIVAELDTPERGRLMSVSRLFYLLTAPYLYGAISIDLRKWNNPLSSTRKPNVDGTEKTRPLTPDPDDALPQAKRDIRRKIGTILLPHRDRLTELDQLHYTNHIKSNDLNPLPDRFTFTTHLTLSTHLKGVCSDFTPPHMPNLEVLRIRPNHAEPLYPEDVYDLPDVKLCNCHQSVQVDKPRMRWRDYGLPRGGDVYQISAQICQLTIHLRPTELIIGDMATDLHRLITGLHCHYISKPDEDTELDLAPWIKRVTIIVGQKFKYSAAADYKNRIRQFLPITVKVLTIVCASSGLGLVEDLPWRPLRKRALARNRPIDPFMVSICAYPVNTVEVVGIDTIDDAWKDGEVDSHIKLIREGVKRSNLRGPFDRGRGWVSAYLRSINIKFTKGDAYAKRDKEGDSAEDRRRCETVKRAILSDMVLAIKEAS